MLVLEPDLFKLLRTRIGIQIILLGSLFMLGCSDTREPVESIQLNASAAEHAEFSTQGVLALSSGAQVGIYERSGAMIDVIALGTPEGIWRVSWQGSDHLWIYDRRRLLHYSIQTQNTQQALPNMALAIRTISPSAEGLLIATEASELLWLAVTVDEDEITTAQHTEVISQLSRSILNIGIIKDTTAEHTSLLYAATNDGQVQTWALQDFSYQEEWLLNDAVQGVFPAPERAYWAVTNRTANPLARQNQLTLVHIPEHGRVNRQPLHEDFSVRSLHQSADKLILGGSNNRWISIDTESGTTREGQHSSARNPLRQGTIAAIFIDDEKVFMITSRGELQIWEKTRIFQKK